MGKDFKIFTDTGADDLESLRKKDVDIIPLYITFEEGVYLKQGIDISIPEFYQRLSGELKMHPKTSLPSVQDFVDAFSPYLKENKDILYITLNANFSGTYQAALSARELLQSEFPMARIEIVDSYCATITQTFLVSTACDMRSDGKGIDEIVENICALRETAEIVFTVDTLKFLKEGGRIGKAAALLGELLNIKPIIMMKDRELLPISKVRGRNKSIRSVIDFAKEHIGPNRDGYHICVAYTGEEDGIAEFKQLIEEELGVHDIPIILIGICIGIHTGPGVLGIGFFKTK